MRFFTAYYGRYIAWVMVLIGGYYDILMTGLRGFYEQRMGVWAWILVFVIAPLVMGISHWCEAKENK